jgi:hypothetical protein
MKLERRTLNADKNCCFNKSHVQRPFRLLSLLTDEINHPSLNQSFCLDRFDDRKKSNKANFSTFKFQFCKRPFTLRLNKLECFCTEKNLLAQNIWWHNKEELTLLSGTYFMEILEF